MKLWQKMLALDLQLFAEGGGAEGGAAATGESATPNSGVNAGGEIVLPGKVQDADAQQNTADGNDRVAQFKALIEGEYKDLYDQNVKNILQKRLKNSKQYEEKYNAMQPMLEMLSGKYGVDVADIDSLKKAIEDDDSFYEEEAAEKGLTVEQLKNIRKMERENANLKRQMEEQSIQNKANQLYASWLDQANSLKSIYPSFNLEAELQNPRFVDLLKSNIDVRTAYEVIHKDDIIRGAMQFTANTVEQKLTNKIRSGNRPAENGLNSQSPAVVKTDVSKMTKSEREELIERARRGERIVL